MSALVSVFPFLVFCPATAAPIGLLGTPVGRVPEGLGPLVQEVINFLNPHYSPSLKQTVISCITFLLISIFFICPPVPARTRRTVLSRLKYSMATVLYGLLAPDFTGFAAWRGVFRDSAIAVAYNRIFPQEDRKNRWNGAHIAFLRHGGFILQEDDKTTRVLSFDDLVRMIKAGEIERPDVSKEDILARSIRPPLSRRIANWLFYFPIYWFIHKFTLKLPLAVVFVALHTVLTWKVLILRSASTTGIKEPVSVIRKSREEPHGLSALGGDVGKLEDTSRGVSVDLGKDKKVAEETLLATDDGEKDKAQSNTPSSDGTGHIPMRPGVARLLALPFELILLIFCIPLEFLIAMYSMSRVSLKYQWAIISGPCHLGTMGDYIAALLQNFLAWIGFAAISWYLPFGVERKAWIVSSHFLLLQPLVLLLVRPQRIRMKIKESIRQVIYALYSFVYVVARLSILFTAVYSIKKAM